MPRGVSHLPPCEAPLRSVHTSHFPHLTSSVALLHLLVLFVLPAPRSPCSTPPLQDTSHLSLADPTCPSCSSSSFCVISTNFLIFSVVLLFFHAPFLSSLDLQPSLSFPLAAFLSFQILLLCLHGHPFLHRPPDTSHLSLGRGLLLLPVRTSVVLPITSGSPAFYAPVFPNCCSSPKRTCLPCLFCSCSSCRRCSCSSALHGSISSSSNFLPTLPQAASLHSPLACFLRPTIAFLTFSTFSTTYLLFTRRFIS